MRKIDHEGLMLCKMQARVFEKSLTQTNCSSGIFIRRFMRSKVAKRMDGIGFMFSACDENDILYEVEEEYGPSDYGSEKYGREEIYWIGYIYRYWAYTYETTSNHIYNLFKPKELRKLYYPYHSLDPASAIERILESIGYETDENKRQLDIVRKIMFQHEENHKK